MCGYIYMSYKKGSTPKRNQLFFENVFPAAGITAGTELVISIV
jgi:hypothetical protein